MLIGVNASKSHPAKIIYHFKKEEIQHIISFNSKIMLKILREQDRIEHQDFNQS